MAVSALNDFRALNRVNVGAVILEDGAKPALSVFLRDEGTKSNEYKTLEDARSDSRRLMEDFPGLLVVRDAPLLAVNPAMVDNSIEVGKSCYIIFKGTMTVLELPQDSWKDAKTLSDRINDKIKQTAKRPMAAVQAEGNVVQLFRRPGL